MDGTNEETLVGPGRMASPEHGPDYAELDGGVVAGRGHDGRPLGFGPGAFGPPSETKPFFLTSEFALTLATLVALAVTAASSDVLDAGTLWPLATAIVAAYVFSRGFAKSGAPSRTWDPRETMEPWWGLRGGGGGGDGDGSTVRSQQAASAAQHEEETQQMSTVQREEYTTQVGGPMYGQGPWGYGRGLRQQFPIETKPFFLTSEFWGSLALIIALAIGAGVSDDIDSRLFWILATAVTVGYVVSRGIAKSGTKSRSWDPRDDLMQGMRERAQRQG
jgi:hypothetical protein